MALRSSALILAVAISVTLVVCWRIHASNASEDQAQFRAEPRPLSRERILVFSPHCDDEALGVGGFIHAARAAGADVHVVMVTNGDGFGLAAAWHYHKIHVTPALLRRFAADRQRETLSADSMLGVPPDHVIFLGFPDRGIAHLWNENWDPAHPYYSDSTGCSFNPYSNAAYGRQPYAGAVLLDDIERTLQKYQPDLVLAPHPNDDHPDHWATGAFVRAALQDLSQRSEWVRHTRCETYIVHHGDWPVPQGYHPGVRLAPPYSLVHTDTVWSQLALDKSDEVAKSAAIHAYGSQMAMMGRFLLSFVRSTECLGNLPRRVLETPAKGSASPAVLVESGPVSDTVIRTIEPGANIQSIEATRSGQNVCFAVKTRGRTSSRITYALHLQMIGSSGRQRWDAVLCGRKLDITIPGGKAWLTQRDMKVSIPASDLNGTDAREGTRNTWFVSADTRVPFVQLDHAGWRALQVEKTT